MSKFVQAFLLSSLLFLSACGGGSSGGAGSGLMYSGTFSLNLITGSSSANDKGTFTATVEGNFVSIEFSDGTTFSGEIKKIGDVRTGTLTASIVGAVEGCTAGTIKIVVFYKPEEETISGVIGGENVVCEGTAFTLTGTLKGTAVQ